MKQKTRIHERPASLNTKLGGISTFFNAGMRVHIWRRVHSLSVCSCPRLRVEMKVSLFPETAGMFRHTRWVTLFIFVRLNIVKRHEGEHFFSSLSQSPASSHSFKNETYLNGYGCAPKLNCLDAINPPLSDVMFSLDFKQKVVLVYSSVGTVCICSISTVYSSVWSTISSRTLRVT